MMTLHSLYHIEMTVTATGTVTFPTYVDTTVLETDGSDYEVIRVEGNGSVDITSKTNTGFDVTTTGTSRFWVFFKNPEVIEHVE